MDTVSSRNLKNKTAEILRRVRCGERIMVTNRGRPVAVIVPAAQAAEWAEGDLPAYEQAWGEIQTALESSEPAYESWREAMAKTRARP